MAIRTPPTAAQAASEAILDLARSLRALDPPTLPLEAKATMRAMQDDLRALFKPEDAAELDSRIIHHGARLLAALLDPAEPLGLASLPPELAGPVKEVLGQFHRLGFMEK